VIDQLRRWFLKEAAPYINDGPTFNLTTSGVVVGGYRPGLVSVLDQYRDVSSTACAMKDHLREALCVDPTPVGIGKCQKDVEELSFRAEAVAGGVEKVELLLETWNRTKATEKSENSQGHCSLSCSSIMVHYYFSFSFRRNLDVSSTIWEEIVVLRLEDAGTHTTGSSPVVRR